MGQGCGSLSPFLNGLLLGALVAGLVFAIIITLWLTSPKKPSTGTSKRMDLILSELLDEMFGDIFEKIEQMRAGLVSLYKKIEKLETNRSPNGMNSINKFNEYMIDSFLEKRNKGHKVGERRSFSGRNSFLTQRNSPF